MGHHEDEELDLDYVSAFTTEVEIRHESAQRKTPPNDARQKIIEAYEKFVRVAGTRALEKGDGETASEYSERLETLELPPAKKELEELTKTFEGARYSLSDTRDIEADEYIKSIERFLQEWKSVQSEE